MMMEQEGDNFRDAWQRIDDRDQRRRKIQHFFKLMRTVYKANMEKSSLEKDQVLKNHEIDMMDELR